ncbi:Rab effector [Takifugu flavidus]|uniref:Rab effector n=1 Tax=Takifugu flavidus TaxID=433684 RepID=A0A5C6P1H4_9TELE|nr:Rab effector [Takifugu flavidus]
MGRKLDLSGLSDNEAEHVLQVVQRDMKLRKKEEARLSELRQELDEEGSRCLLLSRQRCFNQRCCIRCCSPFTFLLNPKRQCHDCRYNVCKACRAYNKQERSWLCSACQKSRLLKTQTLEWFYNNVRKRFKRFGSAKVLKTLYRKHLVEHSALSELTEGSTYEESVCNEGSICGSDSAFYRQTEEHSMAETLSVALRVAEEAIDEAISKAEVAASSQQEKQNEALYLREHRGELVEELAKTIVEKIINRKKTLADMREEYDQELLSERRTDHQLVCDEASPKQNLWRSHSAFSLLDNEPLSLIGDQPFYKEGVGSALSTWKSVDWLDETGVSSVLKSSDGNWLALQSAKMSHPGLINRRKSLISSTLEREPAALSTQESQGSTPDTEAEPNTSWTDTLQEIHQAIADSTGSDWMPSQRGSGGEAVRDSEGNWTSHEPLLALLKKVSAEITQTSPSCSNSTVDVNLNVEEDEREVAAEQKEEEEKSAPSSLPDNRKEIDQIVFDSDALADDTLTAAAKNADLLDLDSDVTANRRNQERTVARQQLAGHYAESSTGEEEDEDREEVVEEEEKEVDKEVVRDCSDVQMRRESQESEDRGEEDEQSWGMELDEGRMEDEEEDEDAVKDRLCRLVAHARFTYFSSTDDDLDKTGLSEGEWEEGEDEERQNNKTVALSLKICQLEKEVRASQFSSTEDELDRVGVQEEDDGEQEELAVKVCKLAHQANATLFSSTEEELDGAGGGEEMGEVEEESLWTFQTEKAARAAHLSSLVRTSRFSSTEDEQDVEKGEGEVKGPTGTNWERRESFGDLDVKMFDLRDEIENSGEKETWDSQRTDKKEEEEEKSGYIEPEDENIETEPLTGKEMEESPETRGGGEESNEEDEEFDRMINSMLTMTLEDMQGGEVNAEAPENDKTNQELDGKMKEGSESTSEGLRAESAVMETVTETVGASPPSENKNEETESQRGEVMLSRQEDAAVVTVKEDRDGTVGVVRENERTDESLEEDKEENAAVVEDTSVPEGPLTPQEVQLVSEIELYSSVQLLSTLLEQRYSAVSLRSITTEVLKVLNATEELLQGVEGGDPRLSSISLPPNTDPQKLDQQFSRLEENVYVAAGTAYGLEAELSDLEECARAISSTTSDMELSFLEEQVASAAAKVHQSDLQVSNISARIAALKNAGLNVDTHVTKTRTSPVMVLYPLTYKYPSIMYLAQ